MVCIQLPDQVLQTPKKRLSFLLVSIPLLAGIGQGQDPATGKKNFLKGFSELPRVPLPQGPLTLPAFLPVAPRGPVVLGARASGSQEPSLHRFDWAVGWRVRQLASLPGPGAWPRELRIIPRGDHPAWILSLSRPLGPLLCHLPELGWQRLRGGLMGARAPLNVDLDRDGSPETLLVIRRATGSGVHSTAPPGFELPQALPPAWLQDLAGVTGLRVWDLNEDHYEDLLICRGKAALELLLNQGQLDFETGDAVQTREGSPRSLAELRLGPERSELQWALAWDPEQGALLLARDTDSMRFARHGPSLPQDLRILDGRIADVDGDGREELLVLARRGVVAPPRLLLFRLPGKLRGRLESLGPGIACPGAERLALGDLDGDAAVDLLIAGRLGPPIALRNTNAASFRERSFRLSLEDQDDRFHAIGAYVELISDTQRLLRVRWPPLNGADQLMLWLTWSGGGELPRVHVTWTDGNSDSFELQKGSYRHLQRG